MRKGGIHGSDIFNNTDKMSTRVALVHDNKTIIDITHSNSDCSKLSACRLG